MTEEYGLEEESVEKLADIRMELFPVDEVQNRNDVLAKAVEIAHEEVVS